MVFEEQGPQGVTDTAPMTLYELYLMLENRGIIDFRITRRDVDRPSEVKKGNAADMLEVKHNAYSVYKPNPVQQKNVKSSNLAGFLNFQNLEKSTYLQLVWRALATT